MNKLSLDRFEELVNEGNVVLDLRDSVLFCDGFIADSISIPFNQNFVDVFQDLVDDSESVLLVANEADLPFISKSLSAHGIANVSGYLEGGFEAWQKAEKEIDMLIGIEADEFAIDYNYDEFYLVDTRSATDYGDEHIEDSENISLPDLQQVLIDLEANGSYYVYATTAINAITAGSIFKKNGFARVRVITCDYETLKNSGLPLYKANKKQSSTQDKFSKN